MRNLTKGEMVTRVIFGVGIVVATLIPLPWGNYLNWLLAAILIITGITMYCPVCHIVDKS